jgi:diguanylate cyclase (GGDEF)-like protein
MPTKTKKDKILEPGLTNRASRTPPDLTIFYGLWSSIALVSVALGHSMLSHAEGLFLLGGISLTNLFFILIPKSKIYAEGQAELFATAQTLIGLAWISAFFYFSTGAGELVLGMYMNVLMFAVIHVNRKTLLKLAAGSLASYLFVIAVQLASAPALISPLHDSVRFLILIGIVGWACVLHKKFRGLRNRLQDRNEELQRLVDKVSKIAAVDELTKSFNRRHLMEILARERARATRQGLGFSVLLFDIDNFKNINDQYGHLVGDQVLQDFAARAKNALRGIDTLNPTDHNRSFGRYGGEEFLAVLPSSDLQGAERVAERVRKIICKRAFREIYTISASVGVAEYQHGETVLQLLERADNALYQAKSDGRNRVRCSTFNSTDPYVEKKKSPALRILR